LLAGKDFLRALGALRGFAVNPGLDFHREGAKHAKKTRRTLVGFPQLVGQSQIPNLLEFTGIDVIGMRD